MKEKTFIEKLIEIKESWEKTKDIMGVSMNFTVQPGKVRILLFCENDEKRNAYEVDFEPRLSGEEMGDWEIRVYVSSGYLTCEDFILIMEIAKLVEKNKEELRLAAIGCCPIDY